MENQELMARDAQCVMQTYGRFPIAIDHGQGALLYDVEGREYVDFTSGIGVSAWATATGSGPAPWVHRLCAWLMCPIYSTVNRILRWPSNCARVPG